MIKIPLEYKIAQEILEECFPVYLGRYPRGSHFDQFTKDALHMIIKGFAVGRGYDWTRISFGDVQQLLYHMVVMLIERGIVKDSDPDYVWLHHIRKQFVPESYPVITREPSYTVQ